MHKRFIKIKNWLKSHWKVVLAVVVILGGGVIGWLLTTSPDASNRIGRDTSSRDEAPITLPAPLTGIEVDPSIARRPVTGVMIENSPNARPQSGLDSAGIVFEAVTEGGITRFLALFQDQDPDRIGPIRSVRPPFVDWFMGFDAAIAHVGGSAEALNLIANRSAKDIDQFRYAGPYYRSNDRIAPHNMYSSVDDLRRLQNELGYRTSKFKEIPRSDDNPAETPTAPRVTIDFSSSLYQAQFRYRAKSNDYARYLAGNPHIDRETGEVITPDNVVVVKMPSRQNGQYVAMDTIGSGEAILFKDGKSQTIRWRQRSYNDRIELLNSEGEEVPLNRGQTWFSILPSGRTVTY